MFDVPGFRNVSRSLRQNRHSFAAIRVTKWCYLVLLGLSVGLDLLGVLLEIDGESGVAGCVADKI